MVTVVTAPEKIEFPVGSIRIFLAGGIQKCREWQKELIDMFKHLNIDTDIGFLLMIKSFLDVFQRDLV